MFGGFFRERRGFLAEVGVFDFSDGNVHVDTVKERAGKFAAVVVNLDGSASTFVGRVAEIATGAGIHGRN